MGGIVALRHRSAPCRDLLAFPLLGRGDQQLGAGSRRSSTQGAGSRNAVRGRPARPSPCAPGHCWTSGRAVSRPPTLPNTAPPRTPWCAALLPGSLGALLQSFDKARAPSSSAGHRLSSRSRCWRPARPCRLPSQPLVHAGPPCARWALQVLCPPAAAGAPACRRRANSVALPAASSAPVAGIALLSAGSSHGAQGQRVWRHFQAA